MAELILLATAWGPRHGGINAFNMDFAKALGRLLGPGKVVCVVLEASENESKDAAAAGVRLLKVIKSRDHDRFESTRADDVLRLMRDHGMQPGDDTAWIGHDIHTGELANRIVEICHTGISAVIQHMSFRDYISYRDGIGAKAKQKHERQKAVLLAADSVFAVGPLLLNRLADIVAAAGKTPHQIIPGLTEEAIPSQHQPSVFRAVTLGRLGPADDRIKQGRLAVAALASACRTAHADPLMPAVLHDVEMLLYGIDESGGTEEAALHQFAQDRADRVITLLALEFSENRQDLFDELCQSSVAMMLSWHEGFGLSGWEAIAAGVPLIASRKSGLYELIKQRLGDAGLALLKPVDIKGKDDPTGDINFHMADEETVKTKLLELAGDLGKAKKNALELRQKLLDEEFTWADAACRFVADLQACAAAKRLAAEAKPKPAWDIAPAKDGSPYPGLQAMTEKHAKVFFGRGKQLAQLKDLLAEQRFVIVIGASGAGKSSLVWAGLLPKLEEWKLGGIAHWPSVRITPANKAHAPMRVLAAALAAKFSQNAIAVEQALQEGGAALRQCLEQISQTDSVLKTESVWGVHTGQPHLAAKTTSDWQLLLFVDQFEELFSLVEAALRKPFIDALDSLMASGKVRVVATMRAEFLGQCMDAVDFGERLTDWFNAGKLLLAAPKEDALREMVLGPAEQAGLSFEDRLAEQIVKDTGLLPGNLALMAFALELLFQHRQDRVMTWDAYKDFKGVEGAIAERADAVFKATGSTSPEAMSSLLGGVFRELVEIDEHSGASTRKRAALALWGLGHPTSTSPPTATQQLILDFIAARLLLTDCETDPKQQHEPSLEVAHEALFRNWPLLAGWIAERKDQFLLRKRLQRDAAEWHRRGRPHSFRWVDQLALDAGDMLRALPYDRISDMETDFLGPVHKEDMLRLIRKPDTAHETRATIGLRLALLGDDRPGVGVKSVELSPTAEDPVVELTRPHPNPPPQGEGTVGLNAVILPDIVWCEVPAGRVELEDDAGSFEMAAFQIAKYPVTQAQYKLFVEACDGYHNEAWWKGLPKRYYDGPGRQIPDLGNHPAVNVDWVEAVAYCRWLSEKRGAGNEVRLPTEWEWQQAACNGNADNAYPWGTWDGRRCNSYESQLNRTIAVGLYAQDWPEDRPLDMAGNVWEWCWNEYANIVPLQDIVLQNQEERTIRGGSWLNNTGYVRCAVRFRYHPVIRNYDLGFRLVLGSPW